MIDSMQIAATGMQAQEKAISTIAHNLSNLNTPGFKKTQVRFADMMHNALARAGQGALVEGQGTAYGLGSMVASEVKVFTQGAIETTGRELDVAIRGPGFLEVRMADGERAYTRAGSLVLDANRMLTTPSGEALTPSIEIPLDSEAVIIGSDGTVEARIAGEDEPVTLGRLELVRFSNPGGLEPIGQNLYLPTLEAGDMLYSEPGQDGSGLLAQGYLETSNVEMVDELTRLLTAQRAYELNARVIQASDELLAIVNNMRR